MYEAKYRAANPEKVKERRAKRYVDNKERELAAVAKYRASNPEKVKEGRDKYRASNPEKAKEGRAKYYADNKEKEKRAGVKYRADNPEKVKTWAVIGTMCRNTNLKPSEIPQELIDLKLKQLQMKQVIYANS